MTKELMEAIKDKLNTRKDIAKIYGQALKEGLAGTDWKLVNQAIIERWSITGLIYIKNLAWKGLE